MSAPKKIKDKPVRYSKSRKKIEDRNPEASAIALDLMTDPFEKLTAVAEECGLNSRTITALVRRMKTRYQPLNKEIKAIKTPKLLELIEEKIQMCLEHMDDYTFANAELRDLAVTFGILAEKRQLLRGEPTQILSMTERNHMNELIPMVVKEANRRGMTIDMTPGQVSHEPGIDTRLLPRDNMSNDDVSATSRKFKKKPLEPTL